MTFDVDAVFTALELVLPILIVLQQMNDGAVKANNHDVDVSAGQKALRQTEDVWFMGEATDFRHFSLPGSHASQYHRTRHRAHDD